MNEYTGGPAFPCVTWKNLNNAGSGPASWVEAKNPGMELRDYFAAQALALVLSQDGSRIAGKLAEKAYEIADAMLKEREK